ncbi:MAG: hydrogenase maturation nickel metallochaperone HypA [Lachnospiraceae bacterium]|nr:hydrogenase maturation nickel metallochaperone HypA [Lachnospiraceae bacterium]
MHEMGVMLNIVDEVDEIARQNQVKRVCRLTLEIGDITGVLPEYMEACWPAIQEQYELFADAELKMIPVKAYGTCQSCGKNFDLVEHDGTCPFCRASRYRVISGDELIIRDIAVE